MLQLSRPADCLTDLTLDLWTSGELSTLARARAASHMSACERCRRRHEALERERAAFYAAAPSFEAHAAALASGRKGVAPRRLSVVWFGSALTALAALVALALVPVATTRTRHKGGPSLGYFVKRGERVLQGERDTTVHPGDLIRFTYSTQQPRYLAIFGRDSQATSVYYPAGASAARVQAGSAVALDFSVELDDLLGEERVHALFCAHSFELAPLLASLDETGRLPVPNACQQVSLSLRKVPAP
jgi:hypothetical protein